MKKILFVLLLVMSGAANASDLTSAAERFHDDEYGVTCWMLRSGAGNGISCIPDSLLEHECGPHEEEQRESRPANAPASSQREERVWL